MTSCRCFKFFSRMERQRFEKLLPRDKARTSWRAVRGLQLVIALAAMTFFSDPCALGQEAVGPQLERVDVEAPARRPRSRNAVPSRTPGFDDDTMADQRSSETPDSSAQGFTGFGPNMPALSVITEKSAISMRAESLPSQVDVVTREDIQRLDVRNYSDLFRKVPGVMSFSYGQGEMGNQIQIRGNYGDHGKDVGLFIDGVPQNIPSAPLGGNGMSEISWLAPEMIERIEIIKGPFSAIYGNFAQAGIVNIVTKRSDPSPSIELSGASFGGFRAIPIVSSDFWYPTPFLANEYQTLDGYRDNSFSKRFSTFNKGSMPIGNGHLSLRFNYYTSSWGQPGYIYIDDVRKGIIDRKTAVNSTDGGDQQRWAFVLNYAPADMGAGLYLTAFVDGYSPNFYYTGLPSPQRYYTGGRTYHGGRIYYNFVFGEVASLAVGAETRYDKATTQRFNCINREPTLKQQDYGLGFLNCSWFLQAQVKPAEPLKFVAGLRGDYFDYNVENHIKPANSGRGYPSIISPRLGLVITPVNNVNIFGNKGLGFRSPAATEMSPTSGQKNFELQPAKTDSWDIGFNATLFGNIYFAADYYQTEMEKEVRTINQQPVNIGNTQRNGYELEARFYASKQINLFASYSWVDASVKNPTYPGQDKVMGSLKT